MTPIAAVLHRLNSCAGVAGSLICSHDGIVVESAVSERFDAEALSALASSVSLAVSNAGKALELGRYTRYMMTANSGNIVITDLGRSLFVVMVDGRADIQKVNVDIFQASNEIKKHANIG